MKYRLFSIFILLIISTILATILVVDTISSVSALLTTIPENTSMNNYLEQVQANYDNYNNSLWSLGNNLQEGDYFVYKICNDDYTAQEIYPYHCYIISLEFVRILESYKGDTWIVQSYLTVGDTINNNNTNPLILLIDPYTFDVTTDPLHRTIGDSIYNTIFSLSQYGEQSLSIGTIWDYMDSYFTNKIPLEIKNKQSVQILNTGINGTIVTSMETSVLSYDIIIPSNTYLHNDFPFPLKSKMYSPHIIYPEPQELYYFELLEYRSNNAIEIIDGTIVESSFEKLGGLGVR